MSRDVLDLIDDTIAEYNEDMPDAMRWAPDAPKRPGGDPYGSGGYTSGPPPLQRMTRALRRQLNAAMTAPVPWSRYDNRLTLQVQIGVMPAGGRMTLIRFAGAGRGHPSRGARHYRPRSGPAAAIVTLIADRDVQLGRVHIETNGRMRFVNLGPAVIPFGRWVALEFQFAPDWPPPLKAGNGADYHRRQQARRHRRRR